MFGCLAAWFIYFTMEKLENDLVCMQFNPMEEKLADAILGLVMFHNSNR